MGHAWKVLNRGLHFYSMIDCNYAFLPSFHSSPLTPSFLLSVPPSLCVSVSVVSSTWSVRGTTWLSLTHSTSAWSPSPPWASVTSRLRSGPHSCWWSLWSAWPSSSSPYRWVPLDPRRLKWPRREEKWWLVSPALQRRYWNFFWFILGLSLQFQSLHCQVLPVEMLRHLNVPRTEGIFIYGNTVGDVALLTCCSECMCCSCTPTKALLICHCMLSLGLHIIV